MVTEVPWTQWRRGRGRRQGAEPDPQGAEPDRAPDVGSKSVHFPFLRPWYGVRSQSGHPAGPARRDQGRRRTDNHGGEVGNL